MVNPDGTFEHCFEPCVKEPNRPHQTCAGNGQPGVVRLGWQGECFLDFSWCRLKEGAVVSRGFDFVCREVRSCGVVQEEVELSGQVQGLGGSSRQVVTKQTWTVCCIWEVNKKYDEASFKVQDCD